MNSVPLISAQDLERARAAHFTLVICHLNRAAEAARIFHSAMRVLAPFPNASLLIVDNGSQDGSAERLGELAEGEARARLVVEPRRGVYYARRRGLVEAQGDFVLLLDDDATIDEGAIAGLLAPLVKCEAIGVVGARVKLAWMQPKPDWLHPRLLNQFSIEVAPLPPGYQFADFPCLPTGVALAVRLGPCTALFSGSLREAYYPLGRRSAGAGESIVPQMEGGEDIDLCQIFAVNGYAVLFANHIRVWLEVPEDRIRPEWFLERYRTEGRTRMRVLRLNGRSAFGPHGFKFLLSLPILLGLRAIAIFFAPRWQMLAAAYLQKSLGAWQELLNGERLAPWPYRVD